VTLRSSTAPLTTELIYSINLDFISSTAPGWIPSGDCKKYEHAACASMNVTIDKSVLYELLAITRNTSTSGLLNYVISN